MNRRDLLRLIAYAVGCRTPSGKMLEKNRRVNFLEQLESSLFEVIEKIMKQQKNPHAGFSVSIFQERVRFLRRRLAGAEHLNVRKMRYRHRRKTDRHNGIYGLVREEGR